ncbi:MAG TPA: squalene synthase HpnC [Candidatus Dormibacteraeota bacterium]|jgi:squalene synthase HpnC|nr:squalene synthase HpnC [Candidatus Dormibacteraeota bacterium]
MLRPGELEIADHAPPSGCSPETAQQFTKWLATHHYENFNVVSWLLPKELHQHFYNVYAYCRWADDLGDEIPDATRALELLDWWDHELDLCYEGKPSHPIFVALNQTIREKDIPKQPFADLLKAFRQDQTTKRYQTWDAMIGYCLYSANPVGRLVLYLCGYRDEKRQELSDATCTALQLANFWQDVSRDLEKGRIYIPLDVAALHGVSESEIVNRHFSDRYVSLMKDLVVRTRQLFDAGYPLAKMVDGRLSIDLEMFSRGGIAVLDAIEAMGYDTLNHRPSIGKGKQARLLGRVLLSQLFKRSSRRQPDAKSAHRAVAQLELVPSNWVSDSYDNCHAIARSAHSSFYPAFFLLPKPKRDGIVALYAFMRLVDDVADEGHDLAAKQRGLAKWRAALDEFVTGFSQLIVGNTALKRTDSYPKYAAETLPALVDTIERYNMPTRYLHDLISGAEMDLTIQTYPTFDRLREYCYRVAGTVGLTCTHIFGFKDPRALDLAEKLGLAFQLTNIIRDVHEDYALGRVYIPDEDLSRYNVSPEDFGRSEATLGVRELLRFEAERAWQNYEEGAELLDLIDADSRGTLWLLVHTYSALLSRIESLDFAVFGERVRLSKPEKILSIARARFGRHTRENVLEKRDRDRRRAGGSGGRRRAG